MSRESIYSWDILSCREENPPSKEPTTLSTQMKTNICEREQRKRPQLVSFMFLFSINCSIYNPHLYNIQITLKNRLYMESLAQLAWVKSFVLSSPYIYCFFTMLWKVLVLLNKVLAFNRNFQLKGSSKFFLFLQPELISGFIQTPSRSLISLNPPAHNYRPCAEVTSICPPPL